MLICPICDSALRGRFCPVCKKLVKEPWVLDDRIYINRSHSLPDNFCEYHGNDRKVTYLNRTADKKSPLISGKTNVLSQHLGTKAKIPVGMPNSPIKNAYSSQTNAFHSAFSSPGRNSVSRKK